MIIREYDKLSNIERLAYNIGNIAKVILFYYVAIHFLLKYW
jgi:hypothetical protein